MDLDLDSLLRMIAAVVFGGIIGFNRDIYGKPTGIRAHALVSLARRCSCWREAATISAATIPTR